MGAPAGFEDVVASISPLGDEQSDTAAHWDVTFAVDDADAIAAQAYDSAGGSSCRRSTPLVRMPVIADTAGAVLTASKFVPENSEVTGPAEAVSAW